MHLVQPVAHAIWEQHYFAAFSPDEANKNPLAAPAMVFLVTSSKLTLMTQLFNRVGPLANIPLLTAWKHVTVRAGPVWQLNPYVSIVVLMGSVISIFLISKLGFKADPEFTLAGRKIHIVAILIKGIELGADVASTVSAVALIVLGQPITGGCVLVFMVIQIAARAGVFHEQHSAMLQKQKINPDTPPWFFRDNKKVQEIWRQTPESYRGLALRQNYFWVVLHVGYLAGMVAAPQQAMALAYRGLVEIYGTALAGVYLERTRTNR